MCLHRRHYYIRTPGRVGHQCMGGEVPAPERDDEHHDATRSGAAPGRSKSGTTHTTAAEAAGGTWCGKHGVMRQGVMAVLLIFFVAHNKQCTRQRKGVTAAVELGSSLLHARIPARTHG